MSRQRGTTSRTRTSDANRLPQTVVRVMLAAALAWSSAAWAEEEPAWSKLSASEQKVLAPLHRMWPDLDPARKQKWRDIAARYPKMPVEQQQRLSARMVEWAGMSVEQRIAARQRYEESKQLPAAERQALWEAYLALPDDEKRQLATKADKRRPTAAPAASAIPKAASSTELGATQPKSNKVAEQKRPPAGRPVAPGTVQANVGASTRPITQKPTPAPHQPAGQPKIAASPDLVDRTTLLPQRASGPESARKASQ
ncbi:MAG: hypothetical protein RL722_716 [Pseudomonadota bacterium]